MHSLCVLISRTVHPNFAKSSAHATHFRGLVIPRQRCNRSCTSGLVDDVTLSHNGPNGAGDASGCSWKWLTRGNTDFTSQRILWLTHQGAAQDQGEVWCLRWPLFCRTTSFANAQCKSTVELSSEVNVNTSWTESQKYLMSAKLQYCYEY